MDPPNTGCVMRCNTAGNGIRQCLTFTSRALAGAEEKNKNASFFPASCYWRRLQPCAARPTLPSLTTALCKRCSRVPQGERVGGGGAEPWSHACRKSGLARMQITCPPAFNLPQAGISCFYLLARQLLTLLIPLPDERVTQS